MGVALTGPGVALLLVLWVRLLRSGSGSHCRLDSLLVLLRVQVRVDQLRLGLVEFRFDH